MVENGGIYYSGMGLAYKPRLFPKVIRDAKNIFAIESSVGVITGTLFLQLRG